MRKIVRAKWPRQIVVTAVMSGLIAVIGYMTHMFLPHFVISVWPTTGLYAVAGIWLGAWGIPAAYIGSTISSISALGLVVSATQSISTIFQALIPAWAFRHFKGHPRLRTLRDRLLFLLFGVLLASLVSTLIGPLMWYLFGLVPNLDALFYVLMPGWFLSNIVITPLIGFPLLWLGSGTMIKARAHCRGWFS
jgi:integral membrane sensor domain MASE1